MNRDPFVKMILSLLAAVVVGLLPLILGPTAGWAGPPFVTDDPEPVGYRHWEIYLASQDAKDKDGRPGYLWSESHFGVYRLSIDYWPKRGKK